MKNTLADSDAPKFLLVSGWMRDAGAMHDYYDFDFRAAEPLHCDGDYPVPPVLPVRVDPATKEYLRSRLVTYMWQPYTHVATGTLRIKVTALRIEELAPSEYPPNAPPPINDPWPLFLERFLAAHRRPTLGDGTNEADTEDEMPPPPPPLMEGERESDQPHKRLRPV